MNPNCSFCGEIQNAEDIYWAGAFGGFICLKCIEQSAAFPVVNDTTAICGFCGKGQSETRKLLNGKTHGICSFCVEVLNNPPVVLSRSGLVINPNTRLGKWLLNSKNRFIRKYIVGA